jgi:hypothetical protein
MDVLHFTVTLTDVNLPHCVLLCAAEQVHLAALTKDLGTALHKCASPQRARVSF